MWSVDGRELFYRGPDQFVAATIQTGPTFGVGVREELFEDVYARNVDHANYDVHPRDGRFVLVKGSGGSTGLVVVLNWIEELKERVGK